jgi:hypothetical protein
VRLLLSVDLGEDLLVGREPVGVLVGVGELPVDGDLEDATDTFLQTNGEAVFTLDGGLQTGGLGEIVSLPAVQDLDVHRSFPPPGQQYDGFVTLYMTRPSAAAIPCSP